MLELFAVIPAYEVFVTPTDGSPTQVYDFGPGSRGSFLRLLPIAPDEEADKETVVPQKHL